MTNLNIVDSFNEYPRIILTLREALQQSDLQEVSQENIDKDQDGYLDIEPTLLTKLNPFQYYYLQNKLLCSCVISQFRSQEEYQNLQTTYFALKELNLSDKECQKLLVKTENKFRDFYPDALRALPIIVKALQETNIDHILDVLEGVCVRSVDNEDSLEYNQYQMDFLLGLLSISTVDYDKEYNAFFSVARVIRHYCRYRITPLFDYVSFDWHQLLSPSFKERDLDDFEKFELGAKIRFAKELANSVNQYIANPLNDTHDTRQVIRSLNKVLTSFYNREFDRDNSRSMLTCFAKEISDKVLYSIVTYHPWSSLTAVFNRLWNAKAITNTASWFNKVNPEHDNIISFMRGLLSLIRTDIIKPHTFYFLTEGLKALTENKDDLVKNASVYAHYCDLFLNILTPSQKAKFARQLYALFNNPDLTNKQRAVFAFLIQTYSKSCQLDVYEKRLKELSLQLPQVKKAEIPVESWLSDGCLQARLMYFYDPEDSKDSDESDIVWWFEHAEETYSKLGYIVEPVQSISDLVSTREIHKQVGDVTIRFFLTLMPEEMQEDPFSRSEYDVFVQRGHGGSEELFFNVDEEQEHSNLTDRLFISGACKSADNAIEPDIQKYYAGNYFMGDLDVGKAEINEQIPEKLFRAVLKGEHSWSALNQYKANHFLLPNDNMYLVGSYVTANQDSF